MNTKEVIVIGGGPAGMMAAIKASELGNKVILIEKNSSLGEKLLLTGKGRGNITNFCDLDFFIEKFSNKNGQFLRNAFKKFFNQDLISFFEKRELKLKVERQNRVFPANDQVQSVLEILKNELSKNKVEIFYNTKLKDILIENKEIKEIILENGKIISTKKVILATGGVSFPFTGSTGEGLKISQKLGHTIVPLMPGLVPLKIKEEFPNLLKGLTLKNIRFKITCEKKQIISDIGELLFTHFGISGPLILSLSAKIVNWLNQKKSVNIKIDLKPGLSNEQIKERLLREIKLNSKKSVLSIMKTFLPQRLAEVFMQILKIDSNKKISQINQYEQEEIISLLKSFPLSITGFLSREKAMITQGGISLKEIDPCTMQSRLINGLYFCGEMIDVDADTGGFNLQAAFSTGYLAGESSVLNF
ncbi:MAG: NAD(P)/FAD-dependent oxidoreductase [bacterium]